MLEIKYRILTLKINFLNNSDIRKYCRYCAIPFRAVSKCSNAV